MNGWTSRQIYAHFISLWVIAVLIVVSIGLIFIHDMDQDTPQVAAMEKWGGAVPMDVYQIYDKDTGVYYAVTEQGGICVMETMEGKTKLVDQGDGSVTHPDKGTSKE